MDHRQSDFAHTGPWQNSWSFVSFCQRWPDTSQSAYGPLAEINFAPACVIQDGSLWSEIGRP